MSETINYVTRTTACGEANNYIRPEDRLSTSWDVRADYREGHYFDTSTLRWFGCYHATRREAIACAKATAESLA